MPTNPPDVEPLRVRKATMLIFYGYNKCQTCKNAKKFLETLGCSVKEVDITMEPPPLAELTELVRKSRHPYTDFLNRSGILYRKRKMAEKVKTAPQQEIMADLASEGRLLKRPIVTDGKQVTVGFKLEEFKQVWGS